jgi:hypothetical protein
MSVVGYSYFCTVASIDYPQPLMLIGVVIQAFQLLRFGQIYGYLEKKKARCSKSFFFGLQKSKNLLPKKHCYRLNS